MGPPAPSGPLSDGARPHPARQNGPMADGSPAGVGKDAKFAPTLTVKHKGHCALGILFYTRLPRIEPAACSGFEGVLPMSEVTREAVVDYLSQMPVIELAGLIKTLEDKWGVKAAPVAVAAPAGGGGQAAPVEKEPEKTEVDVGLAQYGANKI